MSKLILYIISDVYMIAFLLSFCRVKRRDEALALVVAGLALCNLVVEMLRIQLEQLGCVTNWMFFLIVAAAVVAVLELSEYRDYRAVMTALMAGCYSIFGDQAAAIARGLGAGLPVMMLAEVIVLTAVFALLYHVLRPIYMRIQKLYRGEWHKFCMLVVMYLICEFLIVVNERQTMHPIHRLLPMLHLALGFLIIFFLFLLFDRMLQEEGKLQQQRVWNAGIEGLQKNVEEIRRAEQRIAAYNHDSRHMIRMISAMMGDHDYDGIEQALTQLGTLPLSTEQPVYCRNYPVNSVVAYLAEQMEYQHITFRAKLEALDKTIDSWIADDQKEKEQQEQGGTPAPEHSLLGGRMKQHWEENLIDSELVDHEHVDGDWELAIVLSGLLRDAMELCLWDIKETPKSQGEKHWVVVNTEQMEDGLYLEIRSFCHNAISFDPDTRLPIFPWKKHNELGMTTIEAFTAWRGGRMECGQEQEQYYVRMIMAVEKEES